MTIPPHPVDQIRWTDADGGAGMLNRVLRPDGTSVQFTYDALGRRVSKSHRQRTTRWLWDGNVVLHEWVERAHAPSTASDNVLEIAAKRRTAIVSAQPAQGPPPASAGDTPITWLFEPDSFVPIAKLVGGERFGIVTDHLGSPLSMFDSPGQEAWHGEIDGYGQLRNTRGEREAWPFRWQGQYKDLETGLYYNRFRYLRSGSGGIR
jgi:YD repeat-containing protein